MSINGVNAGIQPAPANVNMPAGGTSSQIKALEQKLQQLNKEKEKAVKAKDEEKAKKIEEQIQEIKRQIAELKRQETKKQEEKEENCSSIQTKKAKNPGIGEYLDESV